MNELDELLSQSLPAVPDHGFSDHVMRRLWWERARREWKVVAAALLFIALFLAVVPLRTIGLALGQAVPDAVGQWAVALAAWLVAISLLAARQLSRL